MNIRYGGGRWYVVSDGKVFADLASYEAAKHFVREGGSRMIIRFYSGRWLVILAGQTIANFATYKEAAEFVRE